MRPSCAEPVEMGRPPPHLGDEISGRDDVALETAVCMPLRYMTPTSFWQPADAVAVVACSTRRAALFCWHLPDRAARLLGAAAARREEHGLALGAAERRLHERTTRDVHLADAAGATADGDAMAPEHAVAYALQRSSNLPAGSSPS